MASADEARPAEGRRLALVIANGVYEPDSGLTALRGPEVDARRLSEVLKDPAIGDFAVEAVIDRPSSEVREKLEKLLTTARPRDLVVVYLSCHGLLNKQDQTLYFAARDTRRAALRTTATQARWLTELLDECRALRKVLILDCCYSGAFSRGAKSGGLNVGAELIGSGQGLVVLTSSRAVQESYEDEGEDGAFTSVFTAGLVDGMRTGEADRDRDGWISLDEAYHYAREYVQARRPEQNPQRWMVEAEGVIYLARTAWAEAASTSKGPASPAPPMRKMSIRLVRTLAGHRGRVYDAAFSPDGDLIATVGGDGTARLWDCATRQVLNTTNDVMSPLTAVAFSPDGSTFATGGANGTVHLWTGRDALFSGSLKGAFDAIRALAFSPDGALLAAACEDGMVQLWHPGTGRLARVIANLGGPAAAIAFSPDGRTLAVAGGNGHVRLWNPADGELLKRLRTESSETLGLAFGRGDAQLFICGWGVVETWNLDAPRRVGKLVATMPWLVVSVQVSPNGKLVAAASERGELWIWDTATGDLLATQDAHKIAASAVAFHPNGRMLCSVGADERVCLWELSASGG